MLTLAILVGLVAFGYLLGRLAPAWSISFLLFLPLQLFGLAWFDPPEISMHVPWLSAVPIALISGLFILATVQIFRWNLPLAGLFVPIRPSLDGTSYPALLLVMPSIIACLLTFLPGENPAISVAVYGCIYLALAVFLVGLLEYFDGRPSLRLALALGSQLLLLGFALLRGNGEIALLFARFSTRVIAALMTLYLARMPRQRRAFWFGGLLFVISIVSIALISYSGDEDNLAGLLYSAYNQGVSGGGRDTLFGSLLAITGKLVARQDYNEMLRSLTRQDYAFLAASFDSITYPIDLLLRFVGIRAYDNPIGQVMFFLREETRPLILFPSANIPAGLVVTLLSRQSIPLLVYAGLAYAALFSCFLANEGDIGRRVGRLGLIVMALSGELACLFELTPEFGLQVAPMALACLWGSLLVHGLLRRVVSAGPRQGFG
ncbi:MAG: hypothetical protein NTW02_11325 [Cyanobium sp. LacPavin_0920_WC12_MAG_62_9]|nr:hypothetical protein [Cyanobium sp. LacPavin_0920_WC12_MAG_62_9]